MLEYTMSSHRRPTKTNEVLIEIECKALTSSMFDFRNFYVRVLTNHERTEILKLQTTIKQNISMTNQSLINH